MPRIPALGRLRQENPKFKASLGHIVMSCLKRKVCVTHEEQEVKRGL
jgi:hypothetical protein